MNEATALELRDQGYAYYRIADELGITKETAQEQVAAARDNRRTWLTRQGPAGSRWNEPFVRRDPKPLSKKASRHARRAARR